MRYSRQIEKDECLEPGEPWDIRMRKTLGALREGSKRYSEDEIEHIVDEAVKAARLSEQ